MRHACHEDWNRHIKPSIRNLQRFTNHFSCGFGGAFWTGGDGSCDGSCEGDDGSYEGDDDSCGDDDGSWVGGERSASGTCICASLTGGKSSCRRCTCGSTPSSFGRPCARRGYSLAGSGTRSVPGGPSFSLCASSPCAPCASCPASAPSSHSASPARRSPAARTRRLRWTRRSRRCWGHRRREQTEEERTPVISPCWRLIASPGGWWVGLVVTFWVCP